MRTSHILAVAPYSGMAEMISGVAKNYPALELTICTGNLEEGLALARQFTSEREFDLILSRGGTAELIREHIELPVVEIEFSVYDLLRCIKMAQSFQGKFAIVGFSGLVDNARILCDLLQLDVPIVRIQQENEVSDRIAQLKKDRFSLIVSDLVSHNAAIAIGLNSIFVPSGPESISAALNRSVELMRSSASLYMQKELLKNALLEQDEYYVIYGKEGSVLFSTLHLSSEIPEEVKTEFDRFIPSGRKTSGYVTQSRYGKNIYLKKTRSLIYDEEKFWLVQITVRPALFEEDDRSVSVFDSDALLEASDKIDHTSANLVGRTYEQLEQYAPSFFPILITGEEGSGKEQAGTLIYQKGPFPRHPYYVIDCTYLNERKWSALLFNDNSPFQMSQVTIHIRNMELLNKNEINRFFEYASDTRLVRRNRMIFSVTRDTSDSRLLSNSLLNRLSCLHLALVPLRERTEDLSSISMLYINQMNLLLGKQLVGLDADALELLKNYSWPGNLDQFRLVMREVIMLTQTAYISADTVRTVLEKQQDMLPKPITGTGMYPLDLSKPLDAIQREIVGIVLSEENGNRERAAARLGIGRTTIWRILKNQS